MLPEEYKLRTACPFNLPEFNAVRTILVVFSRESGRYLAGSFAPTLPDPIFKLPVPSTDANTNDPIRQRVTESPLPRLRVSLMISEGFNVREISDVKSMLHDFVCFIDKNTPHNI